jgi:DNA-binding GntR family transcriptional regulator
LVSSTPRLTRTYLLSQRLEEQLAKASPGDPVPSENELARSHKVHRLTARAALQELERRHLVRRVQGRGTFVSRRLDYRISTEGPPSFTEIVRNAGGNPSTTTDLVQVRAPTRTERRSLALAPRAQVVELRRTRWLDYEPVGVGTSVLPATLVPGLRRSSARTARCTARWWRSTTCSRGGRSTGARWRPRQRRSRCGSTSAVGLTFSATAGGWSRSGCISRSRSRMAGCGLTGSTSSSRWASSSNETAKVAAMAVGIALAAAEYATEYSRTRVQFGCPIGQNQGVAFMLADMQASVDAAHLLVWGAAWMARQGKPFTRPQGLTRRPPRARHPLAARSAAACNPVTADDLDLR